MGRNALEQGDILQDLQDAIEWMYGDYGGVTFNRIARVRELLEALEDTIK